MCTMGMDAAAMATTNLTPAATLAEAGSREAPALPPGLLTETGEARQSQEEIYREVSQFIQGQKEGCRPTKLFIGGISRHTTTKQLRDHFAQFGRVLDCVAMRQPDGRPRGFGYVTLDSPTAAERCLREPQMIDNRIVDMKAAVPEGSCSGGTSPKEAGFGMCFPGQADYNMGMFAGQGWPEASGPYGNGMPWWNSAKASPHPQGLDCLDLLSAARELAVSQTSSPHGLPLHPMGLHEYAELGHDAVDPMGLLLPPHLADEPQSTLIPVEFQQPPGASKMMSASAPEFVPFGAQAPKQPARETEEAPAKVTPVAVGATPPSKDQKAARARAPLGELTNIVEVEDLLKPFKSPTNKLADMGHGHLGGNEGRPTGLLLDDEVVHGSSPSSSSDHYDPDSTPERTASKSTTKTSEEEDTPDSKKNEADEELRNNLEDSQGPVSPDSSNLSDSGSDGGSIEPVVVDMNDLPSIGSAAHATGECKRCNFFPKGRCQNGKNCSFCHYAHDKRKPSRQEKRERRAAWLEQQGSQDGDGTQAFQESMQAGLLLPQMQPEVMPMGPLLTKPLVQPGCFPVYQDEEIYSDETLAYSIFPGLPPIHATKLPAPLPLPGMDMTGQTGPALPPGLAQPWQPEVTSTRSTPISSAFLGTVPTPQLTPASSVASTPLPTPMATPTAAAMATSSEARSFAPVAPTTATFGTQTEDYKCNKCDAAGVKTKREVEEAADAVVHNGRAWPRDELLRLRDGVLKMPGACETSGGILFTKSTAAITLSAGN